MRVYSLCASRHTRHYLGSRQFWDLIHVQPMIATMRRNRNTPMASGMPPPLIGLYFWIISNTRLHPRTVVAGERCQRGPEEVAAPSAGRALIAGAAPGFYCLAQHSSARACTCCTPSHPQRGRPAPGAGSGGRACAGSEMGGRGTHSLMVPSSCRYSLRKPGSRMGSPSWYGSSTLLSCCVDFCCSSGAANGMANGTANGTAVSPG
jgi:hypothetical protein